MQLLRALTAVINSKVRAWAQSGTACRTALLGWLLVVQAAVTDCSLHPQCSCFGS
jgi:hypothetical protein